jgi:hypothetical protein
MDGVIVSAERRTRRRGTRLRQIRSIHAPQRTDVAPNTIVDGHLAVFLGCHAYVAFIVLPVAHPIGEVGSTQIGARLTR